MRRELFLSDLISFKRSRCLGCERRGKGIYLLRKNNPFNLAYGLKSEKKYPQRGSFFLDSPPKCGRSKTGPNPGHNKVNRSLVPVITREY